MSMKTSNDNVRIVINRDFSIEIPRGMCYSTDKKEINGNRLLVFLKEEQNDEFMQHWSLEPYGLDMPFAAPECLAIMEPQRFGSGTEMDLSDNSCRDLIKKAVEVAALMSGSMFDEGTSGEIQVIKETGGILVYYVKSEHRHTCLAIATPSGVYMGQIWINDIADTDEVYAVMESWLCTVERYFVSDDDKIHSPAFEIPQYSQGKRAKMGMLDVAVPDGFTELEDLVTSGNQNPGTRMDYLQLHREYCFMMLPENFEGGFHHNVDAPYTIHCKNGTVAEVEELGKLWDKNYKTRKAELKNIIQANLDRAGKDRSEVHYFEPTEKLAVLYAQIGESEDPAEYWCSYFIFILAGNMVLQPMVYINAEEDKPAFEASIEDWIFRLRPVGEAENKRFEIEQKTSALGEYGADHGQIDAVKAAQLFSTDIFFNTDDQITYYRGHHHMKGLQINSEVIDDYAQIRNNPEVFIKEVLKVAEFVEQNENLKLPKSLFRKELFAVTHNQAITGITFFNLCAWHMISIAEKEENKYIALLDRFLIQAVPECYKLIAEFIQTLRAYNGKTGAFEVFNNSALVMDSPVEGIAKPAFGAVQLQPETVKVDEGEHPYAGIAAKLTELKKTKKTVKKAAAVQSEEKTDAELEKLMELWSLDNGFEPEE